MRWYKRYGGDFVHGTLELTLEQKGAFSLILDLIYEWGEAIPDNERWLAGICGVSIRKWRSLKNVLIGLGKIYLSDGKISNQRADIELENTAKMTRKRSESGAKGGRKRAENEAGSNKNNDLDQARLKLIDKNRIDKNPPHSPPEPEVEDRAPIETASEPALPDDEEEIIDLEFEKFWRTFPSGRKLNKLKAKRQYRKIVSGREAELKATTGELLAGAVLYASKMVGREDRFTKMPCTWLTNGCWLEDNAGAPPVFSKPKAQKTSNDNDWADRLAQRVLARQAGGSQ